MRVEPARCLEGVVMVPGDKSISHRYAILGAMAGGRTRIGNFSSSADCSSTLSCIRELGVSVGRKGADVSIESPGWREWTPPREILDAGNSGTTVRLLSGALAGRPMESTIAGDESLNRRPMGRIIRPLTAMGATIRARDGEFPPLVIQGGELQPLRYELPVASAQVKSCILLAGLTAGGVTVVIEPIQTRDHTERALPAFGVPVSFAGPEISVSGPARLTPASVQVPGDLSSAVFFAVASLLLPGSEICLSSVGVNPSRAGLLTLLEEAGGRIERSGTRSIGQEPVADLIIRADRGFLKSFPSRLAGAIIPNVIDELPILAVLGTQHPGGLTVADAGELRKKESDRIDALVRNLRAVGVDAQESADGFSVPFTAKIAGGPVRTFGDHRIAMAFAILGLMAEDGVEIDEPECAAVSFPGFFDCLRTLAVR